MEPNFSSARSATATKKATKRPHWGGVRTHLPQLLADVNNQEGIAGAVAKMFGLLRKSHERFTPNCE
jgi:hypothetical protein